MKRSAAGRGTLHSMRARVHDRAGPRGPKLIVTAIGFAIIALAVSLCVLVESSSPLRAVPFSVGLAILAVVCAGWIRFQSRVAEIEVGPGRVRVRRGLASLTLKSDTIAGATTSYHEGGVALTLTLATRDRLQPVTLALANEDEAERVRGALGIPRDGKGETSFPVEEPSVVRVGRTCAIIGGALVLLPVPFALLATLSDDPPRLGAFASLAYHGALVLLVSLVQFIPRAPHLARRVVMRPEALYLPGLDGADTIAYGAIERVWQEGTSICVATADKKARAVPTVMNVDECAVAVSHLEAARRRALGEGPRRVEVAERLAVLRRNDEPVSAWLQRVDSLASLARVQGYRGSALDRDDLHVAVTDVDLALDLRVAAGRVLARVDPDVRVRIAEAATTATSEAAANVLQRFDAPVAEIARAYEDLEQEELTTLKKGRFA